MVAATGAALLAKNTLFKKGPNPQGDPELERMRVAESQRVAKEKKDNEDKIAEDDAAKLRKLRGQRSLLGGDNYTGFNLGSGNTLG